MIDKGDVYYDDCYRFNNPLDFVVISASYFITIANAFEGINNGIRIFFTTSAVLLFTLTSFVTYNYCNDNEIVSVTSSSREEANN